MSTLAIFPKRVLPAKYLLNSPQLRDIISRTPQLKRLPFGLDKWYCVTLPRLVRNRAVVVDVILKVFYKYVHLLTLFLFWVLYRKMNSLLKYPGYYDHVRAAYMFWDHGKKHPSHWMQYHVMESIKCSNLEMFIYLRYLYLI